MKLPNADQIREWEEFTIKHEPVSSIDLMERAAEAAVDLLEQIGILNSDFQIFCGKGNNGGDGLAMARMLLDRGCNVNVYILDGSNPGTKDFNHNLKRFPRETISIESEKDFPSLTEDQHVIDAIFGTGLNRPMQGIAAKLAEHINQSGAKVISIDVPSGLPADGVVEGNAIRADHTITFQTCKLSFLLPSNGEFVGLVHVVDIGLHKEYYRNLETPYHLIDEEIIASIYKPRKRFSHKGNFGHALLIAGSYGRMGAALLATKAAVRAGAGLTTVHIPSCGYEILQTGIPEAMVTTDFNSSIITETEKDLSKYSVIGIGPGIGTASETRDFFQGLLGNYTRPMVIDADALNIISSQKLLLKKIPAHSILTPHPKEFQRLFGDQENDLTRLETAKNHAADLQSVIVLKGHHSFIATPSGKSYFNSTGNAGLAKGGSGDVLTGIITALLAQGYDSVSAAILAVYLHGLAADIAAASDSMEAISATNIILHLGKAYLKIAAFYQERN
jgi:ADP-dependent NAD(P)H-hydrate dehydratase / NAD(P)H-hydrate epimerase